VSDSYRVCVEGNVSILEKVHIFMDETVVGMAGAFVSRYHHNNDLETH
jgi:hypothetical protein